MLQGTVRQIKITPKFILHQNAKFSTRQYFCLYGNTYVTAVLECFRNPKLLNAGIMPDFKNLQLLLCIKIKAALVATMVATSLGI